MADDPKPVLKPALAIVNDTSSSSSGTLTCIVRREEGTQSFVLSNDHVIFFNNPKTPQISSPGNGLCPCCCPKNVVAVAKDPILRKVGKISFGGKQVYVDCALAELGPGVTGVNDVVIPTDTPPSEKKPPLIVPLKGFGEVDSSKAAIDLFKAKSAVKQETDPTKKQALQDQYTALLRQKQIVFVMLRSRTIRAWVLSDSYKPENVDQPNQLLLWVQEEDAIDVLSGSGDSGAAVVNYNAELVGIVHSRPTSSPDSISEASDFLIACPALAVLSALDLVMPPPPAKPTTSELVPVPRESDDLSKHARRAEGRLRATRAGNELVDLGYRHGRELGRLVNHERAVTVAWHRSAGPAWLVHVLRCVREDAALPQEVKGVSQTLLLDKMESVLRTRGSDALRADLARYAERVRALVGTTGIESLVAQLQTLAPVDTSA